MNDNKNIQAIKGMKDILPTDSHLWLEVEKACAELFALHDYRQIRTPVVESTQLFSRSIGVDTDIVSKEMYTFEDRNGDSLTLRPEGTASCVRAGIEHGLFYNQQQRLWYTGPMFRHERPQKGRYRQFYQVGVECVGWPGADIEAEVLSMNAQLFDRLGLRDTVLQINSLGDAESRKQYRTALQEYLSGFFDALDVDSQRRLDTNPLRILDSKNPDVRQILEGAPDILDFLSSESSDRFQLLQSMLQSLGIAFTVNSRLVRGLDYYNDTVFEWVNEGYGAQSTVCGGGRYDSMVEQLGGQPAPCFGFAMGLERLVQMLQEQDAEICRHDNRPQVFIISTGDLARQQALVLQRDLTRAGVHVQLNCGDGSMKNQFKKADKSGAQLAVVIGEQEATGQSAGIRSLVRREEQQVFRQNDVVNEVTNRLESL